MRISSEWLREWVDVPAPDELADIFEMAGIGVEARQDEVFTLEVTSNRGDWLSAMGLAREIAAMTGAPLRLTAWPEIPGAGGDSVEVAIENSDDCARYIARTIEEVQVGPSPDWMQRRLIDCDMRPINNIVDVTNYVMLETGQPLHAFDADKIGGNRIEVRRARPGERLTTLDEVERELNEEVLVIADAEKAVGIAGIMGGANSEVGASTRRILLESAHFAPSRVRRGARFLGLQSQARRRFERWVDPNGTRRAADRALQLLRECAGARAGAIVDHYAQPVEERIVTLRAARCNALLGLQLSSETIAALLARLGLRILERSEGEMRVAIPTWRRDIEREVDLIEEAARLHGYNHVPTTLPRGINPAAGLALPQRLEERAKSVLLRCGLTEVVTSSLQNAAALERVDLGQSEVAHAAVKLRNPLSEDFTQLRVSLLPSLLEVLGRNARRPAQIFELGKVYLARPDGVQPDERRTLGLALLDVPAPAHWQKNAPAVDFFRLKAVLQTLLDALGTPPGQFRATVAAPFHPGRCATLSLDGEDVGVLGEVHPAIAERHELAHRAFVALLDFDHLVRHIALGKQASPLPRHPRIERDLALVLRENVPAASVESVLRAAGGPLLEEVRIFDVYTGAPIAAGFKSLALSLRFGAERTLTDAEVEAALAQMRAAAEGQLGAQLRS